MYPFIGTFFIPVERPVSYMPNRKPSASAVKEVAPTEEQYFGAEQEMEAANTVAPTLEELQQQVSLLKARVEQRFSDEGYLQSLRIETYEDGKPEDFRVAGYVTTSDASTKTKKGWINPSDREMPFVAFGDTARQLLDAYRYKWTVIKYYGNKTCRPTSVQMLDGELVANEVGVTINLFDVKKQSEELSERPAPKHPVREPEATGQAAPAAAPAKTLKSWDAAPLVPDTDEVPF